MKSIKNETTQGLEIFINTSKGMSSMWIKPKQKIIVEESAISPQILTLSKRRILKISNA